LSRFWRLVVPFVRINLFLKNKKNIIVHTPGKVASTSVYVTLKKLFHKSHNVFHFHYISPEGISVMSDKHLLSKRKSLPLHLVVSREFAKKIEPKTEQLKMVVLIRKPISRYISATFQNLNMFFDNVSKASEEEVEQLISNGLRNDEHIKELEWWFDVEIKSQFNIDVFNDDHLVHNNDYWYFKNKNIDVYILQMETVSDVFPSFCEKELGEKDVTLINSNVGSNKKYSQMYKKVKDNITIPHEILNRTEESKFVQRFYKK